MHLPSSFLSVYIRLFLATTHKNSTQIYETCVSNIAEAQNHLTRIQMWGAHAMKPTYLLSPLHLLNPLSHLLFRPILQVVAKMAPSGAVCSAACWWDSQQALDTWDSVCFPPMWTKSLFVEGFLPQVIVSTWGNHSGHGHGEGLEHLTHLSELFFFERKGFIWLILSPHSLSSKEVRAALK